MNESLPITCAGETTGSGSLVRAIVAEAAALLTRLAETGEAGRIDLAGLPLTEADKAALEELLGAGEVVAEIAVVGRSTAAETGHAGVWWVRHYGSDDRIAAETLEITRIPEILLSHPADIAAAARRLGDTLGTASAGATDAIKEDRPDAGP